MGKDILVVLFKNKIKRKIINKFITLKRAEEFYNKLISDSNEVIFEKQYENGVRYDYEVAIILNKKNEDVKYIKDELGRQIKLELEDDNYSFHKINKYKTEEKILDYQTKKKITSKELIKKYLSGDGLKMVSKINNKIVVQNDDNYNLFTLKNVLDSDRFIDSLSNYYLNNKKSDCMFIKDVSTIQRKYLYNILVDKGFPKNYLFKLSTTHLK